VYEHSPWWIKAEGRVPLPFGFHVAEDLALLPGTLIQINGLALSTTSGLQVRRWAQDPCADGSGSGVSHPGFERLLAAICEGRVGAVFAIEASCLARNGRYWHTLIVSPHPSDRRPLKSDRLAESRHAQASRRLAIWFSAYA
jgi:hypothetical protein